MHTPGPWPSAAYALGQTAALLAYILDDYVPQSVWESIEARPDDALGALVTLAHQPETASRRRYVEGEIADVSTAIPPEGFGRKLTSAELGRFWLGYYHQRYDLRRRMTGGADPEGEAS